MDDVFEALDTAIDAISNSEIVKELKEKKRVLDNTQEVQQLLDDFNYAKNKYHQKLLSSKELSAIKGKLYKHPLMVEYLKRYNDLNISIIKYNKEISSIFNTVNNHCQNI